MPDPLTIAFFANANWVHGRRFASFFAERGHRVVMMSFKKAELPGVEVIPLREPHLKVFDWFTCNQRARKILNDIQPDIVHYHIAPSYSYLAATLGYRPSIITIHGADVLCTPHEVVYNTRYALPLMPITIWALNKVDYVTSVSGHLTTLMRAYGVSDSRVATFQYGVEPELFFKINHPTDASVVLSTRNYYNFYRLDILIEAAPLVLAKHPEVTFLFAGDGPTHRDLERRINRLGLGDRCRLLGSVTSDVIQQLCASSAIYASPSAIDGTSLSLLEAMAAGLYPVVSDIPANRFWIRQNEGGKLVSGSNPNVWADAILDALDNAVKREKAAVINREKVREHADWKSNMLRMEQIYYELAERIPKAGNFGK